MAEPAVINASPLIFLSRAGLVDLLQVVSATIIVPEVVAAEIEVRGSADPTAQALATVPWLLITETPPVAPEIQSWGLGSGDPASSLGLTLIPILKQSSMILPEGDALLHLEFPFAVHLGWL